MPMNLTEVSLDELSQIRYTVLLSEHKPFATPEFKIIRYKGTYRDGSAGATDADYIMATSKAAHEAWYSETNILDFTELTYRWGDEMENVFGLGWDRVTRCQHPLVVVVGDGCRGALKSLLLSEYEEYCCETLEEALVFAREKDKVYEECLKRWRERV